MDIPKRDGQLIQSHFDGLVFALLDDRNSFQWRLINSKIQFHHDRATVTGESVCQSGISSFDIVLTEEEHISLKSHFPESPLRPGSVLTRFEPFQQTSKYEEFQGDVNHREF